LKFAGKKGRYLSGRRGRAYVSAALPRNQQIRPRPPRTPPDLVPNHQPPGRLLVTQPANFEVKVVEMYYGIPILEASCREPLVLNNETDRDLARALIEQPYPHFAVVIDYRNITHDPGYGPEEEAKVRRKEPFVDLSSRIVTLVRFQAVSMTSLVHSMRVNMLLRHAMSSRFAPDFDAAVRIARRAIDKFRVPTP
jgi:hypothetical protein